MGWEGILSFYDKNNIPTIREAFLEGVAFELGLQ